jgi:hypothetical protein
MPATPIGQLAGWHIRCVCACGSRTTYALRDLAGVHGPDLTLSAVRAINAAGSPR